MAKKQAKKSKKEKPDRITPAPKVVIKVAQGDAEKIERLPSLLGTIHAQKQKAIADRKAAFEDRDALDEQIAELGTEAREVRTDEYLKLRADLGETEDKIDALDAQIKAANNAYDRVAAECQQGSFKFAELTVDEIMAEAGKKGGGQMQLAEADAGPTPGVGSSWRRLFAAKPDLFNQEWAKVAPHFGAIDALKYGVVPVDNLLVLADYIRFEFERLEKTEYRSSILPKAPEWFRDGLSAMIGHALGGGYTETGDEAAETDQESMRQRLETAADRDPDAWLALVGGADSDANKALCGQTTE